MSSDGLDVVLIVAEMKTKGAVVTGNVMTVFRNA